MSHEDPTNVECFEHAAAALLKLLYQSFPRPVLLIPAKMEDDLAKAQGIPRACLWEPSKARPNETLFSATLEWLAEEGIVRHRGGSGGRFNGVVLTARGFAALNSPILPEEDRETYGQRLARFAEGTLHSGLSNTIAGLITAGLSRFQP